MPFRWIEPLLSNWLLRLPPGNGRIVLTFDDGPDSRTTPALLRVLAREGIPATMFVSGKACATHEDTLREIVADGHSLANHGFRHVYHGIRGSDFQRRSLLTTEEVFLSLSLPFVRLFRPPYGSLNWMTSRVLSEHGYQGVLWSVMVWDWLSQDPLQVWSKLRDRLHDGAIVVLHDGHPTTSGLSEVLPRLAEEVSRRGWRFVTLAADQPSSLR